MILAEMLLQDFLLYQCWVTARFLENYRGILEYSSEYLKVSTKIGNIRVSGSNLVIYHMNQDEILLRGRIGKVSLKGEADEKDT